MKIAISSRTLGCAASMAIAAAGCISMEDLSSYSDVQPMAGAAGRASAGDGGRGGGETEPEEASPALDAGAMQSNDEQSVVGSPLVGTEPPTAEASAPDATAPEPCSGPGEFSGLVASTCYLTISADLDWQQGRSDCQAWGGDLVEIGTPEEMAFLTTEVAGSIWLGASDIENEGAMIWISGTPVPESMWSQGQPDDFQGVEDCVERRAVDDLLNDVPCGTLRPTLCERLLD